MLICMDLFSSRFQKWPLESPRLDPKATSSLVRHTTPWSGKPGAPKLCNRWHEMTRNAPVSHPSAYHMFKAGTHQVSRSNWSCRIFRVQSLQLSNNDKDQPKNIVTPVTPDINSLSIVLEAVEGVQGIHTTRWLLQQITRARGVTLSSKPLTQKI